MDGKGQFLIDSRVETTETTLKDDGYFVLLVTERSDVVCCHVYMSAK